MLPSDWFASQMPAVAVSSIQVSCVGGRDASTGANPAACQGMAQQEVGLESRTFE